MADPAAIVLASIRAYTGRYLTRGRWRETYVGQADGPLGPLLLRQWPLIAVDSVKSDGALLAEGDDYRIDWNRARIDVCLAAWPFDGTGAVVVEYDAGYDPLPDDLAAIIEAAASSLAGGNDLAGVQSVDLPDVGSVRFGDGGISTIAGANLLPALQPYAAVLNGYRDTSLLWMQRNNHRVELLPPVTREAVP